MLTLTPVLTDKNFMFYACQHYLNPQCQNMEEFCEDLRRMKYIRKLLTRAQTKGELKERLILNHIIVLSNVFSPEALCRMFFLKMEHQMQQLKPFLIYLNLLPERVYNVKTERVIDTDMIPMDNAVIAALRKI